MQTADGMGTKMIIFLVFLVKLCESKSFSNADDTSVLLAENQREVHTVGKSRMRHEIWRQNRRPHECDRPNECLRESPYCGNGGHCYFDDAECLNWCECKVGFTGNLCESPDINVRSGCTTIPRNETGCRYDDGDDCGPGGRCIYHGEGIVGVFCQCDPGWPNIKNEGCFMCCPKKCVHGECYPGDGMCKCEPYYTGEFCEIGPHIPTTATTSTCDRVHRPSNGCQEFSESNAEPHLPCRNGICIQEIATNNLTCQCDPGWVGDFCDICCSKPCGDNGVCRLGDEEGEDDDDNMSCSCLYGYTGELCQLETETPVHWSVIAIFVGASVASLISVLLLFYCMWRRRVPMAIAIVKWLNRIWLQPRNNSLDCNYRFDAFVSYRGTPEDESFVVGKLREKLEGKMKFKLCLHFRDFTPGETIADNIIWAVYNSRKTILLLSPSYVQGEWTRFEYQVAQHQMLKLRHRILPVIYRDISDVDDLDENLRIILSSVTYLEWPGRGDSKKEDKFWKRLNRAMSSSTNTRSTSIKPTNNKRSTTEVIIGIVSTV